MTLRDNSPREGTVKCSAGQRIQSQGSVVVALCRAHSLHKQVSFLLFISSTHSRPPVSLTVVQVPFQNLSVGLIQPLFRPRAPISSASTA